MEILKRLDKTVECATDLSASDQYRRLVIKAEVLTKLTTLGLLSCVSEDGGFKYSILYQLVRANGLGDYADKLSEILYGPAAAFFSPEAYRLREDLTEKYGEGSWQHEAVASLGQVITLTGLSTEGTSKLVKFDAWFKRIAFIRNKTTGHGDTTLFEKRKLEDIVSLLKLSIELVQQNASVINVPWAYLKMNLSGKYRVTNLSGDREIFAGYSTRSVGNAGRLIDGMYLYSGGPRKIDLIEYDAKTDDFLLPNGGYRAQRFELHSPITEQRRRVPAQQFEQSPDHLAPSESEGTQSLEVMGSTYTNIPEGISSYVDRKKLEKEIIDLLDADHRPVITLVGRGGVGKTSLALKCLKEIAFKERYDFVYWFSARDIDLLPEGPKAVTPKVLTLNDIARFFVGLIGEDDLDKGQYVPRLCESLRDSSQNGRQLFVFDNFETVRDPIDVYNLVEANVRVPNKVLITSRIRDFRGDFPVEITGMEPAEAGELIDKVARKLNILNLLKTSDRDMIIEESDGHPYIIRILLGEYAANKKVSKAKSVIVRKENVLEQLFERTFQSMTPLSQRALLILGSWNSYVPRLTLEAVLQRGRAEKLDPAEAVDELLRMSMVQQSKTEEGAEYVSTPLAASLYAGRQLNVSPDRLSIQSDIKILQLFGALRQITNPQPFSLRLHLFSSKVQKLIEDGLISLSDAENILEYIARNYRPAWLELANLKRHIAREETDESIRCVRKFLEGENFGGDLEDENVGETIGTAWKRMALYYQRKNMVIPAADAWAKYFTMSEPALSDVAGVCNWANEKALGIADFERREVYDRLADVLTKFEQLEGFTATNYSQLAWLKLHALKVDEAERLTKLGLAVDAENDHCQKLAQRLKLD